MPIRNPNLKTTVKWNKSKYFTEVSLVLDLQHDQTLLYDVFKLYDAAEAQAKVLYDMQMLIIDRAAMLKGRMPGCESLIVSHPFKDVLFEFTLDESDSITLGIHKEKTIEEVLAL